MKRTILSLMCLLLACAIALCGVNQTLNTAQSMYQNARTETEYKAAKAKFESAYDDVSYVAAEHEAAIKKGIKDCDAKIAQLSGKLTVNGSASQTSIKFDAAGGSTTLPVSTNQGTPAAKSSAAWLTVDSRSATSITIACAANDGPDTRTATVTVSAGSLSVRVNATQEGASLAITAVEFGRSDGDKAEGWGEPLYAEAVRYVQPRVAYISPMRQTKTIGAKIYKAGTRAPEGYTHTMDCTLEAGANTLLHKPYEASAPGLYVYEVWIDGSLAHSSTFVVREKFDGIKFTGIEFGSTDDKGNQVTIFGSPLYKDVVCLVNPRVHYNSPAQQRKRVQVKVYKPDGSFWTPSTTDGYALVQDVAFKPGTNTLTLKGLGWPSPQFDLGDYKYEIWVDGMLAISGQFTIKAKEDLKIKGVNFSFSAINGRAVVTPRISYSSPSHQKKTVYYKYRDANGKLIKDSNSPSGYTSKEVIDFKQGSSSHNGRGRANSTPGKFAPGVYNVEIWIDGKQQWSGHFEVQAPTE
ncbi:MAG: BACON domain-containing protein [Muribaculaceae bacterium]|nr:BACON domain-containing protein [Muribaculaceae bacterium]